MGNLHNINKNNPTWYSNQKPLLNNIIDIYGYRSDSHKWYGIHYDPFTDRYSIKIETFDFFARNSRLLKLMIFQQKLMKYIQFYLHSIDIDLSQ